MIALIMKSKERQSAETLQQKRIKWKPEKPLKVLKEYWSHIHEPVTVIMIVSGVNVSQLRKIVEATWWGIVFEIDSIMVVKTPELLSAHD